MLKKILTTFAFIMLWCLSTVAWAQTKTLNLNEGRIDIWPDGYTQGVAMSSIDKKHLIATRLRTIIVKNPQI